MSQIAQPQKRELAAAALDAVTIRVLELRAWLRKEGGGAAGAAAFASALASLRLTPEDAALLVPKALVAHRAAEQLERTAQLSEAASSFTHATPREDADVVQLEDENEEPNALQGQEPADYDTAVGDSVHRIRDTLSENEAAVRIQAAARGMLVRRQVAMQHAEEDAFLGMAMPQGDSAKAVASLQAAADAIALSRRELKLQYAHQSASAKGPTFDAMLLREGVALREDFRTKLLAWVTQYRSPDTGDYPDLPPEDADINAILDAAPADPNTAKGARQKQAVAQRPVKKGAPVIAPPSGTPALTALHATAAAFSSEWNESSPQGADGSQPWRTDLLEAALRPGMVAQLRSQAASEVRQVIVTMRAASEAERAANPATAVKGSRGGKAAGAVKAKTAASANAPKPATPPSATAKKAGQMAKDLTADIPVNTLAAELAAEGVLRFDTAHETFSGIVAPCKVLAEPVPVDAIPPPAARAAPAKKIGAAVLPVACVADVIEALVEYAVLPLVLASPPAHTRGVLIAGAAGSECALLALASASAAGAAVLDLTPTRIDGKQSYAGKAGATMLVHKVFKVARAVAPAVVFINDAHLLFATDKRTTSGMACMEPLNRMRKDILREAAMLAPDDRVLLLLATHDPAATLGKDAQSIGGILSLALHVPLPPYGDRFALLRHLGASGEVASQLAQLTAGRTSSDIAACWRAAKESGTVQDFLPHLAALGPVDKEADATCAQGVADIMTAIASRSRE